jgi:hypothetical protein
VATPEATTSTFDPREAEVGSCLYHFTTADIASIILDQSQLRMSPVENMNDPREAKDWIITPKSALGIAVRSALKARGKLTAGRVAYTDMNPALTRAFVLDMAEVGRLGMDLAIDAHAETHLQTLLFTKLLDWATEEEYRFVLRGSNNTFEYIDFGEALLSCCIGPDYPQTDPSGVVARLRARGAPIHRVQWINGHPELVALS